MTEKIALRQTLALFLATTMMILLATVIAKNDGMALFIIPISIHFFLLVKIEMDCLKDEKEESE